MTDMDFVLMCLGLGFAFSVIFIGKRGGGCMRNPPPPIGYVRPAPPPFPSRPYSIEKGGRNPPPPDHYIKPAPTPPPPCVSRKCRHAGIIPRQNPPDESAGCNDL